MGIFNVDFDAVYEDSSNSYEPLPDGNYEVVISKAETKKPKSGELDFLSIWLKIDKGEYTSRIIFLNLSVQHSNPKVVNIAMQKYQKLCRACGWNKQPDSLTEFLDKELFVTLKTGQNGKQEVVNIGGKQASIPQAVILDSKPVVTLDNDEIPF